jgi:hypothetical protein
MRTLAILAALTAATAVDAAPPQRVNKPTGPGSPTYRALPAPLPEDTAQRLAAKVSPEFREWVFHSDRTIKQGSVAIISHAPMQPAPERWLALATEVACRLQGGPARVELGQLIVTKEIPEEIARDMAMMQTPPETEDPDAAFRLINRKAYWFFDIDVSECPTA